LAPRDDQSRVNHTWQLDLFYPATSDIAVYTELKAARRDVVWARNSNEPNEWLFERGEFWLYVDDLFDSPFALQVGRQRYFDDREWWWEEDLDSVRLRFDLDRFHADLGVAEELLPVVLNQGEIDPELEDVLFVLGSARWRWWRDHEVALFALHQHDRSSHQPLVINEPHPTLPCLPEEDIPPNLPPSGHEFYRSGCPDPPPIVNLEDDSDATLTWLGGTLSGRHAIPRYGRVRYWLQTAGVFGRERYTDYSGPTGSRRVGSVDRHDVSGWGLEVGGAFRFDLPATPYISFNFATGSGDPEMTEEHDTGFRQTGLQDNSERLDGVVSLGYYGELLDPELSNLSIWSLGFGFRFLRKSSFDFMYHRYRQNEAAPFLRDTDINRDPDGVNRSLGEEWDVIVGIEEWERVEFKLIGALFRPGAAFEPEAGELSYLLSARVRLNL
jgi:hypothetical protein